MSDAYINAVNFSKAYNINSSFVDMGTSGGSHDLLLPLPTPLLIPTGAAAAQRIIEGKHEGLLEGLLWMA